ncbi:hypothetical protein [Tychonema sp. LEGE 06208]|uniref:hypothetical protein n=1 Tax=Tychonema sp. LEGE 06208 TaxID=1828663 RepID=UPI00187FFD0D|nr:hypothetical protein [Tychonema sp. LEGE 06208]MBE9162422.1 hypothetical protein [Tychonema sp. LEGE 06208]
MLCARRRSIAVGRRAILYVQQLTAELGQLLGAIARRLSLREINFSLDATRERL